MLPSNHDAALLTLCYLSAASKRMMAECFKGIGFTEIHVVRNRDRALANFDTIQGVLLSFSTPTSA